MPVSFDHAELDAFAATLAAASRVVAAEAPKILSRGALNIKNQQRKEAAGTRHFRIAPAISYDVTTTSDAFEAEIGPDRDRDPAARLANIAYFGGSNGGGGTLPDPGGAVTAEEPLFVEAVTDLGAKALGA